MRVMVIVKATGDSEAGRLPAPELLEAMMAFNEELVKAGLMLAGEGLKPSSAGKRVAFDGASRTVLDGPFAETKELIAGYWLWQVKDMGEAVAWVKRCPTPCRDPARSRFGRSTRWTTSPKWPPRKWRQAKRVCGKSWAAPERFWRPVGGDVPRPQASFTRSGPKRRVTRGARSGRMRSATRMTPSASV